MNINGNEIAIREFTLEAMGNCHVKSLYGRAKVRVYGNTGVYSLLSYGTEVAAGKYGTGELYRIYDEDFENDKGGWSATTAKHLESFAAYMGATYGGRKEWKAKEYTTIEKVLETAESDTDKIAA